MTIIKDPFCESLMNVGYLLLSMLVTRFYIHVKQSNIHIAKDQVKDCIMQVKYWLTSNRLRLNPSKTEI